MAQASKTPTPTPAEGDSVTEAMRSWRPAMAHTLVWMVKWGFVGLGAMFFLVIVAHGLTFYGVDAAELAGNIAFIKEVLGIAVKAYGGVLFLAGSAFGIRQAGKSFATTGKH